MFSAILLYAVLLDEGQLLGSGSMVIGLHAHLGVGVVGSQAAAEHLHGASLKHPAHVISAQPKDAR
jgi:hypothetical protein